MVLNICPGRCLALIPFTNPKYNGKYCNFKTRIYSQYSDCAGPFQDSISGRFHQNDCSPRTTSFIDYWPLHIGGLGADCKPSCSSYEDGQRAQFLANCIPERTHLSGSIG